MARLDASHELAYLIAGGKTYQTPVENLQRILDLGTGTGIWAIEFAQNSPQTEVFGIDIM